MGGYRKYLFAEILYEVIKHQSVQEVVVCEIDPEVIRLCQKHFPELACSFDDPRVTVINEDAAEYIKTKKDYFDVIIVDSSDPIGPAIVLFEQEFYQNLFEALQPDGIAVTQAESMFYDLELIGPWHKRNKTIFPHAYYYFTLIPTYPSGTIGFSFCSKKHTPFEPLDPKRIAGIKGLRYYNPNMHQASFALPQFLHNEL